MEKRGREAREISFHDQQVLKTAKAMTTVLPRCLGLHRQGLCMKEGRGLNEAAVGSDPSTHKQSARRGGGDLRFRKRQIVRCDSE